MFKARIPLTFEKYTLKVPSCFRGENVSFSLPLTFISHIEMPQEFHNLSVINIAHFSPQNFNEMLFCLDLVVFLNLSRQLCLLFSASGILRLPKFFPLKSTF